VKKFLRSNQQQAAPVSVDIPLISNQDAWLNIALIKQYHENMPQEESERVVLGALQRLDLARIAYKRNPALTNDDRFYVMLLRAAMVRDAAILIDQPFKIIPHLKDVKYIFQALEKIEDLYSSCHIYDYEWMAEKYGALCP
jgi:ABC-type nitrate/sulfonate/bicarbonate transport system ATPase subunit